MKNLKRVFVFEVKSLIGRIFLNREPKTFKNKKNYLNLGSGRFIKKGYVNADFFKLNFIKNKNIWNVDLRYKLNCKNKVFDGVFTEHTLEHLTPQECSNLFLELNRTMKKGAMLRIIVPDLEKYIKFYNKQTFNDYKTFNEKFKSGCEAVRNITQNYLHCSVWDYSEMKKYLERAGFVNIKKQAYLEGYDKCLLLDSKDRKWESLYIEAKKQ
jgi:predicted SAM-dependent methyltransferase